jgi:hypothetical protein
MRLKVNHIVTWQSILEVGGGRWNITTIQISKKGLFKNLLKAF